MKKIIYIKIFKFGRQIGKEIRVWFTVIANFNCLS